MQHGSSWKRQIKLQMSLLLHIDMDMFYDKDKKEYYCLRCQYRGSEEDVLKKNEMARFRYGAMYERYTKFDFD